MKPCLHLVSSNDGPICAAGNKPLTCSSSCPQFKKLEYFQRQQMIMPPLPTVSANRSAEANQINTYAVQARIASKSGIKGGCNCGH